MPCPIQHLKLKTPTHPAGDDGRERGGHGLLPVLPRRGRGRLPRAQAGPEVRHDACYARGCSGVNARHAVIVNAKPSSTSHVPHTQIISLLVDFAAFPAKLVEMIQGCCCCCPPSASDAAAPPAQFSARCVAWP